MSNDLEQLQVIRQNLLDRIAELTASPKPDYAVDGERYDWGTLLQRYFDELRMASQAIVGNEPFEFQTEGGT